MQGLGKVLPLPSTFDSRCSQLTHIMQPTCTIQLCRSSNRRRMNRGFRFTALLDGEKLPFLKITASIHISLRRKVSALELELEAASQNTKLSEEQLLFLQRCQSRQKAWVTCLCLCFACALLLPVLMVSNSMGLKQFRCSGGLHLPWPHQSYGSHSEP